MGVQLRLSASSSLHVTSLNDVWVANYYSARNPLRLSSLVILGVVARMFRCAVLPPSTVATQPLSRSNQTA